MFLLFSLEIKKMITMEDSRNTDDDMKKTDDNQINFGLRIIFNIGNPEPSERQA